MWVSGETFYLRPNEFSSNSAKRNADQGAFPHTENDRWTLLSVDMSQVKNGELPKVKFACDAFVWQLQVTNPLQVQNGSTVHNH